MFGDLLGSLVDKEKITHDTIQECLEEVAKELGCGWDEFFISIKPKDEKFEMRFDIYRFENKVPKFVRQMTLKEILGIEEE